MKLIDKIIYAALLVTVLVCLGYITMNCIYGPWVMGQDVVR